ncbi:hypothetical protein KZO85_00125 [Chromohalobacter canadensis]|uniref:hypothetical protein n=1 Tax=Chromohalobacter canadensis TaxID=141389 RepID=UPI0021BE8653|nr:hypothetical protein [Chromohalobacter canadensis]MCT8466982.1 hypothetical protein [Chromohalobacter canadensis]
MNSHTLDGGQNIVAGDLITTNYHGPYYDTGPYRVLEVKSNCRCRQHRQRLPHWHITAENLATNTHSWFNGYVIDSQGRLRHTARTLHRVGENEFARIHSEILVVEKAQQGSLF